MLNILSCPNCSYKALPPKYACSKCRSEQLELQQVDGKGTIYSYTTIHVAPEQFAHEVPYHLILVDLENGLRITARLLEGTPGIGERVEFVRMEKDIYWFLPSK